MTKLVRHSGRLIAMFKQTSSMKPKHVSTTKCLARKEMGIYTTIAAAIDNGLTPKFTFPS